MILPFSFVRKCCRERQGLKAYSWLSKQVIDAQYLVMLYELECAALDLLGIRLHDGSRNYQTHIGGCFIWMDRMHIEGDYLGRNAEIAKLQFLFKHLRELRASNSVAFDRVRKMVRKAPNEAQYFGARMEAYVAASLVRASIPFACRESPDFELKDRHAGVMIECGSCHLSKEEANAGRKISLAVANKCNKPYASRSVVLCMDATNPVHHAISFEWPLNTDAIRTAVQAVINTKGFGSVLLLFYGLNSDATEIAANYIRVDAENADDRLLRFMDEKFPRGAGGRPVTHFPDRG